MPKHKHAESIKAWADGAKIQFRYRLGLSEWSEWKDIGDNPFWDTKYEYRVKPEKSWYRVALFQIETGKVAHICASEKTEAYWPKDRMFVKWLTERIEYES